MKKTLMLMLAIVMMLMLSFTLIACDSEETDGGSTTTTTTAAPTTSSSTTSPQKQKYEVKLVDGLTGALLEKRNVSSGDAYNPLNNYADIHYGYKLNEEKFNTDRAQKVTSDRTITLEFLPKEEYTIQLQDINGALYTTYEFTFKQRLTPEQIAAGKVVDAQGNQVLEGENPIDLIFGGKNYNDYAEVTLDGVVKVYEGDSILNLPAAKTTIEGAFSKWMVVKGASEGIGGAADADSKFTGSAVDKSYVIRPKYVYDGAVLYINEFGATNPLLGVNLKDRYNEATERYDLYNDEEKGNEYLYYGTDDSVRCDSTTGVFRLAHKFGNEIVWDPNNVNAENTNKFTGAVQTKPIQIDATTFATYDGGKVYLYTVVRDDTPFFISDRDMGFIQQKLAEDPTSINIWNIADSAEIRFFFGAKNDLATDSGGTQYLQCDKSANGLRYLGVDRLGRCATQLPEAGDIKMYKYISLVDLDGDASNGQKAMQLYDAQNNNVGYAIGFEFDITGYIQDNFVDNGEYGSVAEYWAANEQILRLVINMQINDRYTTLMTKATDENESVETEHFLDAEGKTRTDLLNGGNYGLMASGGQCQVAVCKTLTIVNTKEGD